MRRRPNAVALLGRNLRHWPSIWSLLASPPPRHRVLCWVVCQCCHCQGAYVHSDVDYDIIIGPGFRGEREPTLRHNLLIKRLSKLPYLNECQQAVGIGRPPPPAVHCSVCQRGVFSASFAGVNLYTTTPVGAVWEFAACQFDSGRRRLRLFRSALPTWQWA